MSSESERQGFHTVARVGEVAEGVGQPFEIDGRVIAVFLEDGKYYAIDDACPHKGTPLRDGFVVDATVTCSWHGWRFNLTDGSWTDNPRARVATYTPCGSSATRFRYRSGDVK